MAKKKVAKAEFPEPTQKKADILRDWWSRQSVVRKWGEVKEEIAGCLSEFGHQFNENSDYQAFLNAGRSAGKLEAKERAGGADGAGIKTIGLKQFSSLTENIDPATLAEAIDVIRKVGGIDQAKALSSKWAALCDEIGEEAAKKAIALIG